MKIEFLCDLSDCREFEFVRPDGCVRLAACNLRGTGYVALDAERRVLTGTIEDGTEVEVVADFAGLGGYLLSKLVAARTRAKTKTTTTSSTCSSTTRQAAPPERRNGYSMSDLPALESRWQARSPRFVAVPTDIGLRAQQYAEQAEQANPGGDVARHRADAVSAASEFFEKLLGR